MRMSNDKWNSSMKISDKFMHLIFFYFAMLIGVGLYCFNLGWYIPLLTLLAFIKEGYDAKFNDGFSTKDLLMDFMGMSFALCAVYDWIPDTIIWMILFFIYGLLNRPNLKLPFNIRK